MATNLPSPWLISNTQLYYADKILTPKAYQNMYSLFDLSNLVEAIILSPKIITLPGQAIGTSTSTFLEHEGILELAEVEEDMAIIISQFNSSTWSSDSLVTQNKAEITRILCDIFPVNYEIANNAIMNSNEWANHAYTTPNWSRTKEFTKADVAGDSHLDGGLAYNGDLNFMFNIYHKAHPKVTQEILTSTFVRALFYLMIASSRNYNYCPDSIRIPIIAFLNSIYSQDVFKATKKILMKLDDKVAEKINLLNDVLGHSKFEIKVPSAFSLVLKASKNKEDILQKAVELRNSADLKKFRSRLAKLEESAKKLDPRFLKQKEELEATLDTEEYDFESIIVQSVTQLLDVIRNIAAPGSGLLTSNIIPGDKLTEFGVRKIIKYFKTRNLSYLRNLGKQLESVRSSQKNIEAIFGFKLSQQDIKTLYGLRAYQFDYLKSITTVSAVDS